MNFEVNLSSRRARRARLGQRIGHGGAALLWLLVLGLATLATYCLVNSGVGRAFYLSLAPGLLGLMMVLWYQLDLVNPAPLKQGKMLDDTMAASLLGRLRGPLTPRSVWKAAAGTSEGLFVLNHLLVAADDLAGFMSETATDMPAQWLAAEQLRSSTSAAAKLNGGTLILSLLGSNEAAKTYLAERNIRHEELLEIHSWLDRLLDYLHRPKPYFGGIGRDWATGFTPNLEHFSQNVSQIIEAGRVHYHFLAQAHLADSIVHDLSQGSGGVAIVGPTGTGKTSLVYGLAERLLEGRDPGLQHYQVISLNASLILSSEKANLESLMLTLFGEAVQAGNIILFLDEAQLFFGDGVGAFDMSQILLPVLQARRLKIIAAFTPNDFQRLKTNHESLASSFSVITANEPSTEETMKIVEDSALTLEGRTKLLVSYEAVREAVRLSGQYMSDQAYPGKAINVLEQAVPYATDRALTAVSVQTAIEKTLGVKPGAAKAAEADILLNLEAKIHERMINQVHAVNAVAAALRRVRAGVTSPNRPAGSFLFLGPTGVGKTELARSLAAAYFGSSDRMVRLDMSEYQRPDDVARLLADGADSAQSLILAIRKQPFSVVLLDEIEKAHPNVLNLLLQLLDEGQLTDANGRTASFKSAIIITTSNAGSTDIIQKIMAGESLDAFQRPLIDKLIQSGQFKPELINRFDEVVLFRPLGEAELTQVARLMIDEVNQNLAKQNINVQLTDAALAAIAKAGYDPQFGARPMRHIIQRTVEDVVATRILQGSITPGSTLTLDTPDLKLPS